MSTTHTPGPWGIEPTDSTLWIGPLRASGKIEAIVTRIDRDPNYKPDSIRERDANARLIAAAPELLEACETFAEWLDREEAGLPEGIDRDTPEGEAAWRSWYDENLRLCDLSQVRARAAIAKAKGTP